MWSTHKKNTQKFYNKLFEFIYWTSCKGQSADWFSCDTVIRVSNSNKRDNTLCRTNKVYNTVPKKGPLFFSFFSKALI